MYRIWWLRDSSTYCFLWLLPIPDSTANYRILWLFCPCPTVVTKSNKACTDYRMIWWPSESKVGELQWPIVSSLVAAAASAQGSAEEWSLGCVKPAPAARESQDAGITQPMGHSLADPCNCCWRRCRSGRHGVLLSELGAWGHLGDGRREGGGGGGGHAVPVQHQAAALRSSILQILLKIMRDTNCTILVHSTRDRLKGGP